MYLSVYLARCGVCSRRKAAELIKEGLVVVNKQVMTNPAYEVQEGDHVVCDGEGVKLQSYVYVVLNKPKGIVTSCEDEKGRMTVIDCVKIAAKKRLFPVGRLDKATTGVIVLTNDGDWAQQLSHPKYQVRKTYIAKLDKPLTQTAFLRLKKGVFLSDGKFVPDKVFFPKQKNKWVIGLEIHSGKYRIIRRALRKLGYYVEELTRTHFGNATVKGMRVGEWRQVKKDDI